MSNLSIGYTHLDVLTTRQPHTHASPELVNVERNRVAPAENKFIFTKRHYRLSNETGY